MQPAAIVHPKTQQEIIDSFKSGEIDAIECVWMLHNIGIGRVSQVTQVVVRKDRTLPPKKRDVLNRAGSAMDTYVDIEPYLDELGVYKGIEKLGQRTQEEVLRFYMMMERDDIKAKITERTNRNISFPTLMFALMVGKKVPWEKDAQYIIGMGAASERSKAEILRNMYDELQRQEDESARTAVHFAWAIRHNWNHIRTNRTIRDTYRNGDKMPENPWAESYCRLIHAAIKVDQEYTKRLEEKL